MTGYNIAGLLLEIVFFALGVYLYLFARKQLPGQRRGSDGPAEEFRKENKGWLRILGLALAAIMLVNIILHVGEIV